MPLKLRINLVLLALCLSALNDKRLGGGNGLVQAGYTTNFKFWKTLTNAFIRLTAPILTPHYKRPVIHDNEEFDFIIVGGGTAGCVLARRLSEVAEWRILVIEAGKPPNYLMEIPALAGIFFFSEYNWGFTAEPQTNFGLGLEQNRVTMGRGRGLGGSSLINFMISTRGSPKDYEVWNDYMHTNDSTWSYDNVLPYFIRAEDSRIGNDADPGYHGDAGPLCTEYPSYRTKGAEMFVRAAGQAGYKILDYNGRSQLGSSLVQGILCGGRRASTERVYLRPVKKRPNLYVLTQGHVTQVLFDNNSPNTAGRESPRARGVQYYDKDGKLRTVRCSKEVILSAGAYQSPQLLMLSGIGPASQLARFNVPLLLDRPVGTTMYDHVFFPGLLFTTPEPITFQRTTALNPLQYLQYVIRQRGMLTMVGASVEAMSYVTAPSGVSNGTDRPDLELVYVTSHMAVEFGFVFRTLFRITDRVYNAFYAPLVARNGFMVMPTLLHPMSAGRIELQSADARAPPKIFNEFVIEGRDMRTLVEGIRTVQKIIQQPELSERNRVRLYQTPIPGCETELFDSDEYWECAIRQISSSFWHNVATCKMGPDDDPEAIVDERLRVRGVSGLRVIDCSVVPVMLGAHTNVPTVMIAEKGSDIIKEDYNHIRSTL